MICIVCTYNYVYNKQKHWLHNYSQNAMAYCNRAETELYTPPWRSCFSVKMQRPIVSLEQRESLCLYWRNSLLWVYSVKMQRPMVSLEQRERAYVYTGGGVSSGYYYELSLIWTPEMWPPLYSGHSEKSQSICFIVQMHPGLYNEHTPVIRALTGPKGGQVRGSSLYNNHIHLSGLTSFPVDIVVGVVIPVLVLFLLFLLIVIVLRRRAVAKRNKKTREALLLLQ